MAFFEPGKLAQGKELRKADGESVNSAFMGSHKENDCDIMNNILENKFH